MRSAPQMRVVVLGSIAGLVVAAVLYGLLYAGLDRTRAFRAQARAGQSIVEAIDEFHRHTGRYPGSLAELVPDYLHAAPDVPDRERHKDGGWDYGVVTNGLAVSYKLRYYMGRGGVEYEPPNWIGNDEGHRKIITGSR